MSVRDIILLPDCTLPLPASSFGYPRQNSAADYALRDLRQDCFARSETVGATTNLAAPEGREMAASQGDDPRQLARLVTRTYKLVGTARMLR
jgi:hypothetical protein